MPHMFKNLKAQNIANLRYLFRIITLKINLK